MPEPLGVLPERPFMAGALLGRLFVIGALREGIFCVPTRSLLLLLTDALPVRPDIRPALFTV